MKRIVEEMKRKEYKENSLLDAVRKREKGEIPSKYLHFFSAYEKEFQRIKNTNKKINLLEIGVSLGGSLWTWKEYFTNIKRVVGIDNDPARLVYADASKDVHVLCGQQEDKTFLEETDNSLGPFDIIIDDGSHKVIHQKITFEVLWPLLSEGGIYVIEDLHTSFWGDWGGSFDKQRKVCNSSGGLAFFKDLVDLQYWYCRDGNDLDVTNQSDPDIYEKSISSIHFYDSLCFIHKDSNRTLATKDMLLHLSPEALE